MPMFPPAVCDNCGTVFQQRLIALENATNVSFTNVGISPCPSCGGSGHVPDGAYNVIGDVMEIFAASPQAGRDLQRIAALMQEARKARLPREAIAQAIRRETPSLSGLADLLPQNRSDLYAFISMVAGVAALWFAAKGTEPVANNTTINQVFNQMIVEAPQSSAARKPGQPSTHFKKEKRRTKKSERQRNRQ